MSWSLFSDAGSVDAASKLLKRAVETCNVLVIESAIETYHKGGYKIYFTTPVPQGSWSDMVVYSLSVAQKLGRGWQLFGNITEAVDAWSNEIIVSGIRSAHLIILRNNHF